MAGGRAVPIRYYDNDKELRRIFDAINGMVWPGGLTWLYQARPAALAHRVHTASHLLQ